jgi:N-acetylglutamate synthase-like GNAT family acetyltransferase
MIRKARLQEVREIFRLLADYSSQWNVLPRSLAELYSFVRDFFVYREDGAGPILGIGRCTFFGRIWGKSAP